MKYWAFLLLAIFFLSSISALCEKGQIDINSASLGELDKLSGIGPVKAQAIIDSRSFSSIDDLIDVNGIGEVTLENIKTQRLACVSEDETEEREESSENKTTTIDEIKEPIVKNLSKNNATLQEIDLNPKAIKSEESSEVSGKRNYAFYGLFAFSGLLGLLFLIKNKKFKNEFR